MPEMHDTTVLDDVVFAFLSDKSFLFCSDIASGVNQGLPVYDLCLYKSFLKVRMNDARGLWRAGACSARPGLGFFRAGREKGDEVQHFVGSFDKFVQSRFVKSQFFEIIFSLGFRELRDFGLDLGIDFYYIVTPAPEPESRSWIPDQVRDDRIIRSRFGIKFTVSNIQDWFAREQGKFVEVLAFIRCWLYRVREITGGKGGEIFLGQFGAQLIFLFSAFGNFFKGVEFFLDHFQVG